MTDRNGVRGNGRRPLQSRSAENLTSFSFKPTAGLVGGHELKMQTSVGKSRSAEELVTDTQRERELQSPAHNCDAGRHACRYGKRLARFGARHRSTSRDPPAVERVLSDEEREQAVSRMHREFSGRRKGLLNGLPTGCTEEVCCSLSVECVS